MLYDLGFILEKLYGPFRLLSSHLFLIIAGTSVSFVLILILLPRFYERLPHDRGREFAAEGQVAKGKPTGAGMVFISIFTIVSLFVVPLGWQQVAILVLTYLAMLSGYIDDRSQKSWGEYVKGLMDLIIAVVASLVLLGSGTRMWLPITHVVFQLSPWLFVPISTIIIWFSINSTNCTDGVDGLSSTLVILALISLGVFHYFIIGHTDIAAYLLLPHYEDSPRWAIMAFVMVGSLAGYLWYNAHPSEVLMGDAGSRALGFFIGVLVISTGNPFLILIVSTVILVNGGAGLVKVALLRFFKIRIFHTVRFPLHDHFRITRKWSNAQVLIRFALVQILITIVLFGIFMKVR
ncbi:MAG TPA: phospho-N-acetylmuramoyl-pentapeptide-transferase [Spirochaetia bacterium]|nr:phospho-N-acetylmuramoyl-pentapeptide-transferase [Spirochaetia bacterium]